MAFTFRILWGFQNIKRGAFFAAKPLVNERCLFNVPYSFYSNHVISERQGSSSVSGMKRDPASFFFNDDVQSCLLEMNMRNTTKVFQPRKEGQSLSDVNIKFLTSKELEEEEMKARETARYFLQVPPLLLPHEDRLEILSQDPALQGLEDSKILFTDISYSVPHCERLIVARDADGTLRHASREERYRMIQTYFPDGSRTYEPPQLFSFTNLKALWKRSEFPFILDRACVQFEPDDPDYISVTSSTFDYIDEACKYDDLVGTRHYGAMAFYLVFNGRLDKFLKHCILKYRIEDAVTLVKVYYLTKPDIEHHLNPSSADDTNFLKEYISNYSKDKAALSVTLNAYLELNIHTTAEFTTDCTVSRNS